MLTAKKQKTAFDLAYKYLRYQKTKQARDPDSAKRSHLSLHTLNEYSVDINKMS